MKKEEYIDIQAFVSIAFIFTLLTGLNAAIDVDNSAMGLEGYFSEIAGSELRVEEPVLGVLPVEEEEVIEEPETLNEVEEETLPEEPLIEDPLPEELEIELPPEALEEPTPPIEPEEVIEELEEEEIILKPLEEIQPNSTGIDTFVNADDKNTNFGDLSYLAAGTIDGNKDLITLIKFNLSHIPSNADITIGKLKLYFYDSPTNPTSYIALSTYAITSAWDESTVTSQTEPSYDNTASDEINLSNSYGWVEWDVVPIIQDIVDGTEVNYGIAIKPEENIDTEKRFNSSDSSNTAYHPILEVNYTIPEQVNITIVWPENDTEHGDGDVSVVYTVDNESITNCTLVLDGKKEKDAKKKNKTKSAEKILKKALGNNGNHKISVNCTVGTIDYASVILDVRVDSSKADLYGTIKDPHGNTINSTIKFKQNSVDKYNSTGEYHAVILDDGEYDIELIFDNHTISGMVFNNVTIATGFSDIVGIDKPNNSRGFKKLYAVDPTKLNFTSGSVTVDATGRDLFKCPSWNFTTQNCTEGKWKKVKDLIPGQEYNFTITPNDPGFGESNDTVIVLNINDYLVNTTQEILASDSGVYDINVTILEEINDIIPKMIIYGYDESSNRNDLKIGENTVEVNKQNYAIDPTSLDFDTATVTVSASSASEAVRLYKCYNYNWITTTCGGWRVIKYINPGQEYDFTITTLDPIFFEGNQSDFDEGTYNNTEWNPTGYVQLYPSNTTGTYISKIFDTGATTAWNNFSWSESIPTSFNSYLTSAMHSGANRTQVFAKDETYYLADMKDVSKRLYLNFTDNLVNNTVLKIYAKQDKGVTIGIYAQSDTSGTNPLGNFTVTSATGEWYNITLSISTPTNAIWLGEGTGSGTDPKDEFDYIYANVSITADLIFRARSDDDNSSWGEFVGPDGTFNTYYTTSPQDLNVSNNRYFQYKAYFETDVIDYSPLLYNITLDYTAPSITILSPASEATYGYNESLALNFSVSDANLDSCWYNLDGGTNVTITSCLNTTFDVATSGDYTLYLFANDSNGLEASDAVNFTVNINAPTIVLHFPTDDYISYNDNIPFNYTASDSSLDTCELWGTFTGTFGVNQTNTTPNNYSVSTFYLTLSDGEYLWNIKCNNTLGNLAFNGNKTFYVDTVNPNLTLSEPTGAKTSSSVTAHWSVTDENLDSCWYNIYRGEYLEKLNTIVTCSDNSTTFLMPDGTFTFNFYVTDLAGNLNTSNSSFSVDTSDNGGPGNPSSGGSSSGGSFSGGYILSRNCTTDWICGDWGSCTAKEYRTRYCYDRNKCNTDKDSPAMVEACTYANCTNEIQDPGEDGIDCGGSCPPCTTADRLAGGAVATTPFVPTNPIYALPVVLLIIILIILFGEKGHILTKHKKILTALHVVLLSLIIFFIMMMFLEISELPVQEVTIGIAVISAVGIISFAIYRILNKKTKAKKKKKRKK